VAWHALLLLVLTPAAWAAGLVLLLLLPLLLLCPAWHVTKANQRHGVSIRLSSQQMWAMLFNIDSVRAVTDSLSRVWSLTGC
jgi:hypothetical protein